MTVLRVFKERGIEKFHEYLVAVAGGNRASPDDVLLYSDELSSEIGDKIEVEAKIFSSKMEAARYLSAILQRLNLEDKYYNIGLWSWLSAFYFDSVCPAGPNGTRKIGRVYRYIPSQGRDWKHIYRHLLANPVRIYTYHQESAKILLYGPLYQQGDFIEQVTSRQDFARNKGIIHALGDLYWDPGRNLPKIGSSNRKKKGTLRRFIDVIQQFDLTYDLYSLSSDDILNLLPAEFDEWKSSRETE
ncbi:MAG: hypothetical protein QMD46_13685 [Methanomicrobiales archaeon]|nr:hypothetical protein [Methanomicrobiales archaeon]MDI6876296.1 hypothetical protein [Methanomicrobiales archaeon]